jgi:hypothetical protein
LNFRKVLFTLALTWSIWCFYLFVFLFSFCGVEDWTQGLAHARQVLCHWLTLWTLPCTFEYLYFQLCGKQSCRQYYSNAGKKWWWLG